MHLPTHAPLDQSGVPPRQVAPREADFRTMADPVSYSDTVRPSRRCCGRSSLVAGCAELGVVSDGTSISVGKPSNGYLVDARAAARSRARASRPARSGSQRDNRYGTDELRRPVTGVARRMATQVKDVKLVVADLSAQRRRRARSRSIARTRAVATPISSITCATRDGKPFEPDAMHVFDGTGQREGRQRHHDRRPAHLAAREGAASPRPRRRCSSSSCTSRSRSC